MDLSGFTLVLSPLCNQFQTIDISNEESSDMTNPLQTFTTAALLLNNLLNEYAFDTERLPNNVRSELITALAFINIAIEKLEQASEKDEQLNFETLMINGRGWEELAQNGQSQDSK